MFAERLAEMLSEKSISMRTLAKETGVSAMSISDWAKGNVQPTAENIYLIAKYFGVSSDYLLGLDE